MAERAKGYGLFVNLADRSGRDYLIETFLDLDEALSALNKHHCVSPLDSYVKDLSRKGDQEGSFEIAKGYEYNYETKSWRVV